MTDFDEGAATRFFQALYSGDIGKLIRLSQLQDMLALAHIYNIPWLTNKCLNYVLDNQCGKIAAEFVRKLDDSPTWVNLTVSELKKCAEEEMAKIPPTPAPDPLPPRPFDKRSAGKMEDHKRALAAKRVAERERAAGKEKGKDPHTSKL
eukprot:sb/3473667/